MTAYYNEIDPFAAQWLRNLIEAGHIAPGDVDERSIVDVRPEDLRGYTQCHFFAGIGGWSYALRLAGWPDDEPVWTGSCPCQPFSAAGKGGAFSDERHLWPEWFRLIRECRPSVVFGEQVAAAIRWGWLDLVSTDLENEGYACGSAVAPACGVGAPHKRERLYFVADSDNNGLSKTRLSRKQDGALVVGDSRIGWSCHDTITCLDGRRRPLKPGIVLLAHGVPNWMGQVRAYGNAIVPQAAAVFIQSAVEALQEVDFQEPL